jgi:hypothetical protein
VTLEGEAPVGLGDAIVFADDWPVGEATETGNVVLNGRGFVELDIAYFMAMQEEQNIVWW